MMIPVDLPSTSSILQIGSADLEPFGAAIMSARRSSLGRSEVPILSGCEVEASGAICAGRDTSGEPWIVAISAVSLIGGAGLGPTWAGPRPTSTCPETGSDL